jgi:hypothetical protein
MAKACRNVIAVDSETGSYWYGARRLQTRAEIDTYIRQQSKGAKSRACGRMEAVRDFLRRCPLESRSYQCGQAE